MNQKPTHHGFSRRSLLRGTSLGAGSVLLSGVLDRIALAAEGRTTPPRFLFVVEGNGCPAKQVYPQGVEFQDVKQRDQLAVHRLGKLKLPEALEPVSAFKDQMAIVHGLSGMHLRGGHSADHGALGCYYANSGRNLVARTIDAELGFHFPGAMPLAVLGVSAKKNYRLTYNCSVAAPGRAQPTLLDPMLGYEQLFGSVAEGEAAARFQVNRYLMDYMQEDIRRVRGEIGSADRDKLDAYLSSYEELNEQSSRLLEIRDRLSDAAPVPADKYKSRVETDHLDAHFEMAAAAMIGGLSNVVTIASGVGAPHLSIQYSGLGIEPNKHKIGHKCDDWEQYSIQIRRYHFELIARFMNKLKQMPEGDGTMLDNTLIVYLSDAASAHHGGLDEWPAVLLGSCGNRLKTDGRCVVYPRPEAPGHRTLNTLYATLLHAAGKPRDLFGEPDPGLDPALARGTLSELLV